MYLSLVLLFAYHLVNLKCCRYTFTAVAKKRNKAANNNETRGKNEFVMQNVNSNVEESMYPYMLVKGRSSHISYLLPVLY